MYAAQEPHPNTQAVVNGNSTPPVAAPAAAPDYSRTYSSYSGDAYSSYQNTSYSGYNYSYSQQGNPPQSQHTGGYENSAAPYQPVNSYQSSNSYPDSSFYQGSTSYYNAPVTSYQNPGVYQHTGYSGVWGGNSYAGYTPYSTYPQYSQPETSGSIQAATNLYAQDYQQQWANYYASLQNGSKPDDNDDCTAPGTESVAVSVPESRVLSYSQPPPPGTQPTWDLNEPSCPEASPAEAGTMVSSEVGGVYTPNSSINAFHREQYSHVQSGHFQQSYGQHSLQDQPLQFQTSQGQQVAIVPGQQPPTPTGHLPGTGFQQNIFPSPTAGPPQKRVNKLQIPTNPRIISTMGMPTKVILPDTAQTRKPAYINVEGNFKASSADACVDAMLKPSMFPTSLRAYVERALSRCKDEGQKKACQEIMKEMITQASTDGSLFTKNWDVEPLFPLPSVASTSGHEAAQGVSMITAFAKQDRSPSRRSKTRWEPVEGKQVEKVDAKPAGATKDALWNQTVGLSLKWEKQDGLWNKTKAALHQQLTERAVKKARKDDLGEAQEGNNSSDDTETDTVAAGGVCLGTLSTAETPEEKMKRQSRTKRFDKGKEVRPQGKGLMMQGKMSIGASASARRATALLLARSAGDGSGVAVEDINWDALTVKGTCQEVEKKYLRLTSAPDPNTVRPEEILRRALLMVQTTQKNYFYKCEQLKSIRQDLTVQRIRNEFTVEVYETHARIALEAGDFPEYNQCQTQLKGLYAEGIQGCNKEFAAYTLLYIIVHHGNNRDLLSSMARLSASDKEDAAIKHALVVRAAVASGNYTAFFRLYKIAPNLGTCLMDLYVEKMRFEALRCMTRAYRPTLQASYIGRILGFIGFGDLEPGFERDREELDECKEWLRAHGAILVKDNEGEWCVDCKASTTTLFMPEPEDAVAHGDANLAVNDFLAQV